MKNKKLYLGIAVLVILLLVGLSVYKLTGNATSGNSDANLDKYSSSSIPQECRLPEGQDLEGWKEHLGHHSNTLYCLDYYK